MRRSTIILLSVAIAATSSLQVSWAKQSGRARSLSLDDAASQGDVEQIKQYIAKDADFNQADSYGYTPLKRAIEGHHAEAAITIIESGKADLNAKDPQGQTPLIFAAVNSEPQIAQALIAKGADVKAMDNNGQTALLLAVFSNQKDLVSLLIEKGADVNAASRTGQTPLSLAQQRSPEIAELLKSKGAKAPDSYGDSPYGDYAGNQPGQPAPGAAGAAARADIVVDVNAIREQMKPFPDLAAGLKTLDTKSASEQGGWIQRRVDNRTMHLLAVERQFADELAFVKPIATQEKAEKTLKAMDELITKRDKCSKEIGEQLREQRRNELAANRESNTTATTARAGMRGARGRSANMRTGAAAAGGYGSPAPYGTPGARTPQRRPAAEVNEPVLDPETQRLVQAWLNCKPEDKTDLLQVVHQESLTDLDALRQVATEEQAKKTAAALGGLMILHEERVQKITKRWKDDDERTNRLQERYGTNGQTGRGTVQPGTQQQMQGMRGRRGR